MTAVKAKGTAPRAPVPGHPPPPGPFRPGVWGPAAKREKTRRGIACCRLCSLTVLLNLDALNDLSPPRRHAMSAGPASRRCGPATGGV